MFEVRRTDDDELCGFVAEAGEGWRATTVFGATLGEHRDHTTSEAQVLTEGLAALAEHWTLLDGETGEEEIVLIQQSSPAGVTVALGYYSIPGTPSLSITRAELDAGRWTLRRTR
jgi:hypothetical protein